MRRLLRGLFVENAALKAVSLVIALILFAVVRGEHETQVGVDVRVVYDLAPDRILTSDPPSTVHVIVRGPWTKLHLLDADAMGPMEIDLAHVTSGDLRLTADLLKLPPGLSAVEFQPPTIPLTFEARITRTLPVVAILEGRPAYGYRVDSTSVSPATVTVTGPREEVDGLVRLETTAVDLDGQERETVTTAALAPLPPHVDLLQPRAPSVQVTVDVVPELAERAIASVPVEVQGLRRLKATVTPPAVRVIVQGERLRTDQVQTAAVEAVADGASIEPLGPGAHRVGLSVSGLPRGVAAVADPPVVTVTLAPAH